MYRKSTGGTELSRTAGRGDEVEKSRLSILSFGCQFVHSKTRASAEQPTA